jgi:hypothetical protein
MWVLLAGLFVFVGVMVGAGLTFKLLPDGTSPALIGISLGAWMLALAVVSMYLFNRPAERPGSGISTEQHIRQLQDQGLLTSADFQARRAFAVEEFEDEGSHYFLELENGSVLYLNGQYLYDYEAIDDDAELNQPQRFPCSDFTIRRHQIEGYVAEIVCRGTPLVLEATMPPFVRAEFKQDRVPSDGQIIASQTYDELKSARGRLMR